MSKPKFVSTSILQILPHLPVKVSHSEENEETILFARIIRKTIHKITEEYICLYTSEEKGAKPWWYCPNTREQANGYVIHISPEEADRIGLQYAEEKYINPEVHVSVKENTQGDKRPAARKSIQPILYTV